jgi:hypothetical protein
MHTGRTQLVDLCSAGILAFGIALLTVNWQSWKAATRNPVEARDMNKTFLLILCYSIYRKINDFFPDILKIELKASPWY